MKHPNCNEWINENLKSVYWEPNQNESPNIPVAKTVAKTVIVKTGTMFFKNGFTQSENPDSYIIGGSKNKKKV